RRPQRGKKRSGARSDAARFELPRDSRDWNGSLCPWFVPCCSFLAGREGGPGANASLHGSSNPCANPYAGEDNAKCFKRWGIERISACHGRQFGTLFQSEILIRDWNE